MIFWVWWLHSKYFLVDNVNNYRLCHSFLSLNKLVSRYESKRPKLVCDLQLPNMNACCNQIIHLIANDWEYYVEEVPPRSIILLLLLEFSLVGKSFVVGNIHSCWLWVYFGTSSKIWVLEWAHEEEEEVNFNCYEQIWLGEKF